MSDTSHQNISVYITPEGMIDLNVTDSPKAIINVNGIRLSAKAIEGLQESAGENPLSDYLANIDPKALLKLRDQETKTFENEIAVVVPHGNQKEVAKEGGKAFIVSTLNQHQLSGDFFLNSSGERLRNFFNAAAKTAKQEGLSLDDMFAVIHLRGENEPYNTASPQEYAHIHLTDKDNINSGIKEGRWFVSNPKNQTNATFSTLKENEPFRLSRPSEEFKESALHRVLEYKTKTFGELCKSGTTKEWEKWQEMIRNDPAVMEAIENGGIRLVIEDGKMHIHGGEKLWQGDEKTRWNQKPKFTKP